LQQRLLPCILLPFCSHMPSTPMMPSTATMLSQGIPELGSGRLHVSSKHPTSIAAVQQPCGQENLAAFTSTHCGLYGTWACCGPFGTWWFSMLHKPKSC
jgi:hypothetical protein